MIRLSEQDVQEEIMYDVRTVNITDEHGKGWKLDWKSNKKVLCYLFSNVKFQLVWVHILSKVCGVWIYSEREVRRVYLYHSEFLSKNDTT